MVDWTKAGTVNAASDSSARQPPEKVESTRRHVVIVGAGFGGLAAVKALAGAPVDVTLIDRRNYHLFQPLLYQVATAGLSPGDIAWPVRRILRGQDNVHVELARVTNIDTEAGVVRIGERRLAFDNLVLATGARHAYFGHEEWEPHAPGLKSIEDATEIRRRILLAFERAEMSASEEERRHLLTFVLVGGGPTGVEMAGAISELARKALAADFANIDPRKSRIILAEAGPRVLSTFPESLSEFAQRALERLGVEVRLNAPITHCDENGVIVGEVRIPAATIVWAAGVAASPVAEWLGAEHDRSGRVIVNADMSVPGSPDIFVIGDTACADDGRGTPLPGVAPAAKQAGRYVARVIAARVEGKRAPGPFRYRDAGNLATIGRRAAVIDFGMLRLKGRIAWWLWGIAHIYFLIGMRNRVIVAIQWLWSYITFDRGARLITGEDEGRKK